VSPRDIQIRIQDMLTCCQNILDFTAGKDFEAFLNDPITLRAVAFELITLGEAVRSLPESIKQAHQHIPWGAIQGIRNFLVHEYYRLDEEVIWKTVSDDIPHLIKALEKIL
jgi:uncharacterized protein with HEPN domain